MLMTEFHSNALKKLSSIKSKKVGLSNLSVYAVHEKFCGGLTHYQIASFWPGQVHSHTKMLVNANTVCRTTIKVAMSLS